ncbi:MAG: hypothetical protein SCAL_001596 [Candidatus Syntrophoarchaeum caldarius]|uniref:Uncharacterized protein n=1 Tax=Candidatus Syntropharchaeum caldarium TaxID=1838285 RepID=A0A1F2P7J5_9EURY|nr:MAG: hypothetical protein SCAL_001596 [Candidatus Syntrophoarchaeum caldarius]
MLRTIETLSDEDLMEQISEGKRREAKIRDFEAVARELGI